MRIPGALEPKGVVGERARVTGLAMNRYADDGMFLDAELELAGVDAMDVMGKDRFLTYVIAAMCVLGAGIVFFVGVSLVLWRRNVQERREAAAVAAERRRSNANFVRWMHVAPKPAPVRAFDKYGIVNVCPAGDKEGDVSGRAWAQRTEAMRDAMIYFRNSPSILFWEAGNNQISPAHMKEMVAMKRVLAPARSTQRRPWERIS